MAGMTVTAALAGMAGDATARGWIVVFWIVGTLVFRAPTRRMFLFAYGTNLLAVAALWGQARLTGTTFIVGNDEFFREAATLLATEFQRGFWSEALKYVTYSGGGYIYVTALLFWVTSLVGAGLPGLPTMTVTNAFVGATLPVAAFRLIQLYTPSDARLPRAAAWFVAAFPILTFYGAVALRDIWIAAGSTWFIYWWARAFWPTDRFRLVPLMLGSVAFLVVGMMRPFSVIPLAVFALGYTVARAKRKIITNTILVAMAATLGGLTLLERSATLLSEQSGLYTELALLDAGSASLGARVLQWPTPLNYVARFALAVVLPVPPPIGGRPSQLLIAIGSVWWYFLLPFIWAGLRLARRKAPDAALGKAVFWFFCVLLFTISITSLDVRHKTALMPVALAFAAVGWHTQSRRQRAQSILAVGCALAGLGAAYVVWKGAIQ
jgi:hypothetical protein